LAGTIILTTFSSSSSLALLFWCRHSSFSPVGWKRNKNKNGESIPYPQSDYSQKLVRMVDNHLIFIFSTSFPCSFLLVALCGGGRIPCLRECV
jgi:hypothetical protein